MEFDLQKKSAIISRKFLNRTQSIECFRCSKARFELLQAIL